MKGTAAKVAIVVDVSVAAAWFLPDEHRDDVLAVLDRVVDEGAIVPALFRWEIENVLLNAERALRIEADDVDAAVSALRDLPISIEPAGERFLPGTRFAWRDTFRSPRTMPCTCTREPRSGRSRRTVETNVAHIHVVLGVSVELIPRCRPPRRE